MGLLDEEREESTVGKIYNGVLDVIGDGLSFYRENYIPPQETVNQIIDAGVSGLSKLGYERRPTTTEANFYDSLDNTIYNLPSQLAPMAKGAVEAIYNPIETATGLMDLLDGANTNLGDVFYDSITPKKYEKAFKDYRTSLMSDKNIENEEMASILGGMAKKMLTTEQGRRELFQQHGLEGLIAASLLPKTLLKLPKIAQQQALTEFFQTGSDPLAKRTNVMPGANLMDLLIPKPLGFMVGEKGAIRLGKTDKLNRAKEMHSKGVNAETIWKETGFAKGQDGGWRMEIDDSQATLKEIDVPMDANATVKGEAFINHPEVLTAYPELKDIDVYPFKYNLSPSTFGYYAEKAGIPEIGINPMSSKTLEERTKIASGELNPKMLALGKFGHELQHAAQSIEDNVGGTSPAMEAGKVFIEENLPDIRSQITNMQLQIDALDTKNSGSDLAQLLPLMNRKTELEKELVIQDQYIQDKGFENYKNTLGELEAFQTQADISMTAAERANRLPAYLQNENARLSDSAVASGVEKGLLTSIEPQTLIRSTQFKRRNDGTYVGFSPALDTPQKLNKLISQLDKLAVEGKDARMWYEDSSNQILNLVQGDVVEAEKIAQIIAITSQGASVETNTGFAFKAYSQYKAGLPIEAGRFPAAQSKKIEDILNGGSWEGRKTNSFYRNLMVEIDPTKLAGTETTQDMWMARAFGLDSEVPGGAQYEIMERITQSIADKHGYKPHQAQAAIWVAVKARNDAMKSVINAKVKEKGWGNNANDIFPQFQKKFDSYFQKTVYDGEYNVDEFLKASYSFADGIEDNLGYINLEAVPGTTTDLLPGIASASAEDVAAYTKDMYSIFLDKDGVDLLAKEVGIVSPGNFLGFGGWKGETNPNVQVRGILSGTQAGGINKADIDLVETYAAIVGTVFKQDGVSYRRAFADKTVGKQNAVDVDIGRTLTKQESVRLYDELTSQFGNDLISPTSSANGAEIINYTLFEDVPISNADFKNKVKQAIIDADLGDVNIGYFRSEGNLLMNDWKEHPNGEQYKNRENITSKSQAVYERMVNQYSKDAETINAKYRKDFGW